MNPAANNRSIAFPTHPEVTEIYKPQATVLVATNDSEIQKNISDLLQLFPLQVRWAKGLEEVKAALLIRESVAACFCGFWLVDGTYRDVVRHLRLQPTEIPAIIVCAPSCPHEYRDYLASLNIRAFDFISHPYRKSEIERILHLAIDTHKRSERLKLSVPAPSTLVTSDSGLLRAS